MELSLCKGSFLQGELNFKNSKYPAMLRDVLKSIV